MSNTPVLSAEEILDAQYKGKQYSALKDKEVFVAMDQFARQESIEFAKWLDENGYSKFDGAWSKFDDGSWGPNFTLEELYNLFEQRNKQG